LSEYGDDDLNLLYKNLENRYTEVAHSIEIIENNKSNELSKLLSEKREKENSITNEKSSRISETEALKNSEISNKRLFYQQESKDLEIELANLKKNIEIARKDYSEKNTEYFTLKNEVEELNNNLSASSVICPLCKQVIGKDNIHHLKNELTQKINKINELENYLHSMVENAAKTKDHISSLEAKIKNNSNNCELQIENIVKDFNEKSKDINDRYRIAINKINDLFEKMTSSIEEKAKTEEISLRETLLRLGNEKASMSDKIKEKQKIVDTITSLEYNFENWCNIIENKLSDYFDETILLASRKRLEDLKEDEGKNKVLKDNQESLLEKYDFWKTGFSMSGIPSMLIDEAIPFMNKRIEYYLDQIGGRYIVSFDTLNKNKGGEFKDKIAVNVYDNLTKANMRKQLSGGQTRVVDIATILTLRDLQNNIQDMKTNIIILDEIFDSLDSKNIEYVSTVLRKMTKGNSINIISHTQIDQLDVDETLRFL
jgi:DNA repair exonuclease SbcCD ATPase subunit